MRVATFPNWLFDQLCQAIRILVFFPTIVLFPVTSQESMAIYTHIKRSSSTFFTSTSPHQFQNLLDLVLDFKQQHSAALVGDFELFLIS